MGIPFSKPPDDASKWLANRRPSSQNTIAGFSPSAGVQHDSATFPESLTDAQRLLQDMGRAGVNIAPRRREILLRSAPLTRYQGLIDVKNNQAISPTDRLQIVAGATKTEKLAILKSNYKKAEAVKSKIAKLQAAHVASAPAPGAESEGEAVPEKLLETQNYYVKSIASCALDASWLSYHSPFESDSVDEKLRSEARAILQKAVPEFNQTETSVPQAGNVTDDERGTINHALVSYYLAQNAADLTCKKQAVLKSEMARVSAASSARAQIDGEFQVGRASLLQLHVAGELAVAARYARSEAAQAEEQQRARFKEAAATWREAFRTACTTIYPTFPS